jgi:peptide/nickel transport system ATP-binding protein
VTAPAQSDKNLLNSPAERDQNLLTATDLRVSFGTGHLAREVVGGISFSVRPGECLAIVGQSGSGKSVTARTLIGLTGDGSQVSGRLEFDGHDLATLTERQWRSIRGARIGFILQDALVSLDAVRPVGREIAEPLRLHRYGRAAERRARVIELLRQVGVPEPEMRSRQLPGELSGGLRQRALIATAIALDPQLLIADEPTTALDVTIQAQILGLLEESKRRDRALIVISHDLAVVSRLADRVAVMRDGLIVEQGPTADILGRPKHPYTQSLLDAIPSAHSRGTRLSSPADSDGAPDSDGAAAPGVGAGAPLRPRELSISDRAEAAPSGTAANAPLLRADGLVKRYKGPDGKVRTVVDKVSFELHQGETLGVVGESGSGKTTTGRMVLAVTRPDAGEVRLHGQPWTSLSEGRRRARRQHVGVVFQDPLSSFDPRWTVRRILADALPGAYANGSRTARIRELLHQVGLGDDMLDRRPLLLSGGQRQRVAIARALAPEPEVIVCDEPVSALDVSIQAQVLDLFADLQDQLGLSYIFISHDLGVIHHMSDRVVVMTHGRIVEQGDADAIFSHPTHPYTQRLLASLPQLGGWSRGVVPPGQHGGRSLGVVPPAERNFQPEPSGLEPAFDRSA